MAHRTREPRALAGVIRKEKVTWPGLERITKKKRSRPGVFEPGLGPGLSSGRSGTVNLSAMEGETTVA